jgi:hypothetical protein
MAMAIQNGKVTRPSKTDKSQPTPLLSQLSRMPISLTPSAHLRNGNQAKKPGGAPSAAAFSKKIENHAHAMALHLLYCNCVCIHKKLKVTPAMAAGVTDRLWEVADIQCA